MMKLRSWGWKENRGTKTSEPGYALICPMVCLMALSIIADSRLQEPGVECHYGTWPECQKQTRARELDDPVQCWI